MKFQLNLVLVLINVEKMDPMESSSEEKIGLAPEMRSLDEDLDQLIFNPVVKSEMRSVRTLPQRLSKTVGATRSPIAR